MAKDPKPILIVEANFYQKLANELRGGATTFLEKEGFTFEVVTVPGALEIPAAVAMGIKSGRFSGFIALGCVIRGETSHYDYVAGESIRALQDLATRNCAAIGTGILTVENAEQAEARGNRTRGNKGASAAFACLSLIAAQQKLSGK